MLPTAVATDPDRLARLRRETEILASLNHPGIASVYGLVQNAVVMELVEGATLPRPVSLDTAMDYAKQIADAVEYAHDRGVIHRDLKPANIKVTTEGSIKILDFGLARALDDRTAAWENPANALTVTMGSTQPAVILGTAAYMAPEQAVGKPADRRADIFSFGVVLYQMLTGNRAFEGESVGETLASVVKSEPDWSAIPGETPPHVRRLLGRMLVKDPRKRLQAIGEVRITLDQGGAETPAQAEGPPHKSAKWAWSTAAVMSIVAAGLGFVHFKEQPSPRPDVLRFGILPPGNQRLAPSMALSPDGRYIVFTRDGRQRSASPVAAATRFARRPNDVQGRGIMQVAAAGGTPSPAATIDATPGILPRSTLVPARWLALFLPPLFASRLLRHLLGVTGCCAG